jgi:hypothetical protein
MFEVLEKQKDQKYYFKFITFKLNENKIISYLEVEWFEF